MSALCTETYMVGKKPFTLCTAPYVDARTWTHDDVCCCISPYVHVRQCMATYRNVRRRITLQMLNYMLVTVVVNGHNCVAVRRRTERTATQRNMPHKLARLDLCGILRPSPYGDAVCVNAAVEINVLDYNVAVRRRT